MTSAREMISLAIQGQAEYHAAGVVFTYSVRVQPRQHGMAEAMAARAGVSRNNIVNQLLEAGIDAVLSDLPCDVRQALEGEAGEVICAALAKNEYQTHDTREDDQ